MRRVFVVTLLVLAVLGSSLTLATYAAPAANQATTTTTTGYCPTYQTLIEIDVVDSNPHTVVLTSTTPGVTVVTRIHVIYPDGTPATLSPQTVSFLWTGPSGQKEFDNVPVTYTGSPGFYNYTQLVTADLVEATGQGRVTIASVACSCSDIRGNRGPTSLTNSETTLTPSDDSHVTTGPAGPTGISGIPIAYIAPIIIMILLILALLLFLVRSRRKKNQ